MNDSFEEYRLDPGNLAERTAVRFPLTLPVHVITSGKLYEGTTENISANGVLLRLHPSPGETLSPGDNLDFLIQVAEGTMGSRETAAIHCVGRVVRAYQDDSTAHAAAIIDEYRFQNEDRPDQED